MVLITGFATFITSELERSVNSVFQLLDQWAYTIRPTIRDVLLSPRESWLLNARGDQGNSSLHQVKQFSLTSVVIFRLAKACRALM